MPDRKSQPSKCGMCKEAFTSRNALLKHLDKKHKFCREWQKQSELEEKTSSRACDVSHINLCPAASSWQTQGKGRNLSVVSKRSKSLASKTTHLPHVNSLAALHEPDEDECDLLTGDDQINSFTVFCEQDKADITPRSSRYTLPRTGQFPFAVMWTVPLGTAVRHSDSLERISVQHNIII